MLEQVVARGASDLHITVGAAPAARVRGELLPLEGFPPFDAETAPGLAHSVMCGRIANRLDLMGAAFTVDAACSSSLTTSSKRRSSVTMPP